MASQHGSRFVSPMFNQNFPPNILNVNAGMDRPPRPQFQRSPNPPPTGSFPPPERFAHGFQNRPQFSNFPGACGFINRPPPPLSPAARPPPVATGNPFSGPSNPSHLPFPPQPSASSHSVFSSRPPPPHHLSHHIVPSHPHSVPSHPHPVPSHPRPVPPHPHPVSSHPHPVPSHPPPPLSQPPFSSQNPFSSHQSPAQHNHFPNMSHPSQQNQFPPMSHSHQHQRFHMNSPSPALRPRFGNSFQRPYRPWNQVTRCSGPRTPFSNRSPNVVKSHQFKDISQQVKKKKQKSREFKKLKDDTTEKPFSCDTCDRAFVTESELNEHISLHIKCDYEKCTFEAHPKIVLLHKKMQHETGYAERISKLKDDAEIKKWREERRKRFPTAENIRKRQAEQAERAARGEVLETKEFGKFKRQREEDRNLANSRKRRIRGHRARRNHFRKDILVQHPGFQQFKVNSESDSDCDSHISLHMFSGLSSLVNSNEEMCHLTVETISSNQNLPKSILNIDENPLNVSHSENNSNYQKTELPVLSNAEKPRGDTRRADESILEIPEDEIEMSKKELIVIEESDDEGPEIIAIAKYQEEVVDEKEVKTGPDVSDAVKVSKINHENARKKEKNRLDVNDGPKVSEIHHEESSKGNQSKSQFTRKETKFNGFSAEKNDANEVRKTSLLEKLLADDIRHERNVILQCIRHIVNNNYFGLAVKKS